MSNIAFRSDIQGLRAIAVIAVMVFHFNPSWLPGGYIGVDLFLVISGFLITSILLSQKAKNDYRLLNALKYFYGSRLTRIVPAYLVMLVLVAYISAILLLPQDFKVFKESLEKAILFNSNNYFATFGDYFAPTSYEQPLLHTWSLAVEIQFYVFAPFIVLLLPKRCLVFVFSIFLFALTALADYRLRMLGIEQQTYYRLYSRLPEFFAGGLAAIYTASVNCSNHNKHWLTWIGLALIVLACVLQPSLGHFPGSTALLPVLGAVLLLIAPTQNYCTKLLTNKPIVWVGALSYSLYLWHWPVLVFLRYYTGTEVLSLGFSFLFVSLTLLLSIVSYYSVERVFRGNQLNFRKAIGWSAIIIAMITTPYATAKVNLAFTPEQLPIEYRRYADPATICHGQIVGDCFRGNLDSDKEILVLGDSHAAMLNYFFDYLGKELGFKARIVTASSCVTIPGFDDQRLPERARKACKEQIKQAQKYLENADKVFLASYWSWQLDSQEFRTSLRSFIRQLSLNADIYIIGQEPLLENHPLRNLRFSYLGLPSFMKKDSKYISANHYLVEELSAFHRAHYIDLSKLPLFSDVPFHKNEMIYLDSHHLNEYGVKLYAQQSLAIFKRKF